MIQCGYLTCKQLAQIKKSQDKLPGILLEKVSVSLVDDRIHDAIMLSLKIIQDYPWMAVANIAKRPVSPSPNCQRNEF